MVDLREQLLTQEDYYNAYKHDLEKVDINLRTENSLQALNRIDSLKEFKLEIPEPVRRQNDWWFSNSTFHHPATGHYNFKIQHDRFGRLDVLGKAVSLDIKRQHIVKEFNKSKEDYHLISTLIDNQIKWLIGEICEIETLNAQNLPQWLNKDPLL